MAGGATQYPIRIEEYRLVVDKGYERKEYPKKDATHAEKGVADALRDIQLYPDVVASRMSAWAEKRVMTVTDWERIE